MTDQVNVLPDYGRLGRVVVFRQLPDGVNEFAVMA